MSLDFNTLEVQKSGGELGGVKQANHNQNEDCENPKNGIRDVGVLVVIFILCVLFSVVSLVLSLLSISNIPKMEPVSIQCDPDLLQKIEKQAQILDEISKSSKTQK